jgi:hypothetical protein
MTTCYEKCLLAKEILVAFKELHEGITSGHFLIIKQILDVRYWWPTLFKDTMEYYKGCDLCQRIGGLKIMSLEKLVTTIPK